MFDKKELDILNTSLMASESRVAEWMVGLHGVDIWLLKPHGQSVLNDLKAMRAKVQVELDKAREAEAEEAAIAKDDEKDVREVVVDNYEADQFQLYALRTPEIPSGVAHAILHSLQRGAATGNIPHRITMNTNAGGTRAYMVYSDEMDISTFRDLAKDEGIRHGIRDMHIHCYTID